MSQVLARPHPHLTSSATRGSKSLYRQCADILRERGVRNACCWFQVVDCFHQQTYVLVTHLSVNLDSETLVSALRTIGRLNLVKKAKFQKWFFWYFFIRNNLSRVDLIIKVVLEFLSDP